MASLHRFLQKNPFNAKILLEAVLIIDFYFCAMSIQKSKGQAKNLSEEPFLFQIIKVFDEISLKKFQENVKLEVGTRFYIVHVLRS